MQGKRLTADEINKFKPTMENPLVVTCDDGYFKGNTEILKIVTPMIKDSVIALDMMGDPVIVYTHVFHHFPSQEQTKMIQMYQMAYVQKGNLILGRTLVTKNLKGLSGMQFDKDNLVHLIPVMEFEVPKDFEE